MIKSKKASIENEFASESSIEILNEKHHFIHPAMALNLGVKSGFFNELLID